MKQVIRRGLKEIIVDEVPDPIASPNHVLVRPYFSLISSGTETADIHTDPLVKEVAQNPSHLKTVFDVMMKTSPMATIREVRAKFSEYAVLGYSGAGVIVEKHPSVTDLALGQRVAYGGEGTGHGETLSIGRNLAARIPDNVPFNHACFTTLGAIAMNAVRQADIQVGDSVVVIGLGLVGQLVSQLVRCQGGVVIATDLINSRIEIARNTGADFLVSGGDGAVAEIESITGGRGADIVIVAAASKTSAPVQTAIKMCRDRGRLVVVGVMPLEMPHAEMYIKELKLIMARAYGPGSYDPSYEKQGRDYPLPYVRWTENRNMEEFLRLISVGRVNVEPLISHEFELEAAKEAYQTIMDNGSESLAVLLKYPINQIEDPVAQFVPKRRIEINGSKSSGTIAGELRFAVVGAGNLVRWEHLPAIKKIAGSSVRAIYSARGAKGKGYGIRFGADYATSDFDEVLNDKEVDVVLVASRHRDHAPQTIASLKAGKHVFVEKPMATTGEECREIVMAVRESGKQLTVGFNRRFAPFYAEMQRRFAKRTGTAVINIRMNASYMQSGFWGATLQEGGAIIGEAVHMVDLMRFLIGCDPVSVSAFSLPSDAAEPIGENNISASFKFEDGSIGNLTYCTVGGDISAGERVECYAPGIGIISEDFKKLVVQEGQRQKTQTKLWPAKGYESQMRSFVSRIRDGKPAEITVTDGAKAFLGSQLMLESARENGTPKAFEVERVIPS